MQTLNQADKEYLLNSIRDIKDFPKPGIVFKDITTLLNNERAYNFLMDHLASRYKNENIDFIAGIEARGFIFGAALAAKIGCGFVPIRKPGKLPYTTVSEKYSLEYGVDEVEIHMDAFKSEKESPKVLLIDDLVATGGTATAAVTLLKKVGVDCFEACFILNLTFLQGDSEIKKTTSVYSVLEID